MAGKVCSCSHNMSWHAIGGGRRLHCKYPACPCQRFDGFDSSVSGLTVASTIQGTEPLFVPNTAPANAVKAFAYAAATNTSDSVVSSFMLDMAAKTLAQQRLNKLSQDGVISTAKLGPNWCRDCRNLITASESLIVSFRYHVNLQASNEWRNFIAHLTITHVAEIFGVPENMLHSAALKYIRQHVDDTDAAEPDDELGVVVGWRTWMLSMKDNRFELVAPQSNRIVSLGVSYRKIQATHYGDRELALTHLASAKETTDVNARTLEVTVTRQQCTCGLYCYTNYEDFNSKGYLDYEGVTANVIPFGVVQMGADQKSLRASDFLINRLIVYYGTTNVNETHCTPYSDMHGLPHFEPWTRWVGKWVDPALVAYKALCQQLADQFEVSVDLVEPGMENPEKFAAIAQFEPIQNELPEWLKGGLTAQ